MNIKVLFMGVIASVTGERQRLAQMEAGKTLRQLLDLLEAQYGEDFGQRVYRSKMPPRRLQMHTRIFVNGRVITNGDLDRALEGSPDVLIYLLPASTGG